MPIEFIKQSLKKRDRIVRFLFLIVCILITNACLIVGILILNNSRGFSLQQFEVKNPQLDSIIHSFVDSVGKIEDLSNDIPIMLLDHLDSVPAFYFISDQKEGMSSMYIFRPNKRIVGYAKTKNKDVIILTSINSIYDFEKEYYKFLIPTNHTKKFDFIYFPDDMYCIPDENGIPCFPTTFEPSFKVFIYKNDKIELYGYSY